MKIIQVIPHLNLGGAETMCENLTYEVKKLGHEVIIISLFSLQTAITERLENANIDVRFLDKKTGFDVSIYQKLRKIFQQEKPDVIHTHIHVTQYVFPIAKSLKIKTIHTVHNVASKEAPKMLRFLNKISFRFGNVIPVALSSLIQESIEEEYGIKKENIPVIFNGIDLERCQPKEDYEIQDNLFKILHIGRFMEQKNHQGLIEAFTVFHEKYPDSVLQLIGDGEKKQEIMEAVAAKGLSDSVQFLGMQENVHKYLHNADMFTLPSLYEGIPITIIEAMGTGLPIVATKVGGVPDMLENGENAILTDVDPQELAASYAALYESKELREKLGQSAICHADRFSAEQMAEKYIAIY